MHTAIDDVPDGALARESQPHLTHAPLLHWLRTGWCIATGRNLAAHRPAQANAAAMAMALMLSISLAMGLGRAGITGEASFSLIAWLRDLAPNSLLLAAVWFALSMGRPAQDAPLSTSSFLVLYWLAALLPSAVYSLWWVPVARGLLPERFPGIEWLNWGLYIGVWAWVLTILWRTSRFIGARPVRAACLSVVVLGVQLGTSWWLDSNPWRAEAPSETDPPPRLRLSQEVFEQQQALLARALDGMATRDQAPVQLYAVVYAPFDESVFLREATMVEGVLDTRLGARERTVTLLNHGSTTGQRPWATPNNLRAAIAAVARRMDPERDLLLLYLTSHGGEDHRLAARHWPLEVDTLEASQLKAWLDEHRIRHRAVIVSACYSGGWVEPLADDHSLVMTASAADRPAYGCGENSPLTYFGEALFQHGLSSTLSLEEAFAVASPRIVSMEQAAGHTDKPSNPQIRVGEHFRARWSEWMQLQANPPSRP